MSGLLSNLFDVGGPFGVDTGSPYTAIADDGGQSDADRSEQSADAHGQEGADVPFHVHAGVSGEGENVDGSSSRWSQDEDVSGHLDTHAGFAALGELSNNSAGGG